MVEAPCASKAVGLGRWRLPTRRAPDTKSFESHAGAMAPLACGAGDSCAGLTVPDA
jgi:hypothetical protein